MASLVCPLTTFQPNKQRVGRFMSVSMPISRAARATPICITAYRTPAQAAVLIIQVTDRSNDGTDDFSECHNRIDENLFAFTKTRARIQPNYIIYRPISRLRWLRHQHLSIFCVAFPILGAKFLTTNPLLFEFINLSNCLPGSCWQIL